MTKNSPDASDDDRRRRAERLLGDLLPDQTGDESPQAWGDDPDNRDDEMRRDVPPHHGG